MTDPRWARLDELFHRLADAAPAERARILDDECDDPSLRRELELLIAADDVGGVDVADVVARAETQLDGARRSAEGDRVGPYTLLGSIGQGGMGTVYVAERSDESYEARVAIKVLRGVGGSEWSARMRAERWILATLKHPGIARLIDGGETASGQPYLVMEHRADHPDLAFSKSKLGTFYLDQGRIAEAAPLPQEAMTVRQDALPEGHPDRVDSLIKVGRLRAGQGRVAEARELLLEAMDMGTRARGEADAQVITARRVLEGLEA